MEKLTINRIFGIISCIVMLAVTLALTFTVSDYYIFNKINEYGVAFCLSQWIKKAGVVLLPMAIFYRSRHAADCAKYILPVAVIVSLCTFGNFFDIQIDAETEAQVFYNSVNYFIPQWLNIVLFSVQCISCVCACGSLFIEHGFTIKSPLCLRTFICAFAAVTPLNIFENFFDINNFPADSIYRFKSFSVWHFAAVVALALLTICAYFCLRNKSREDKLYCLRVMAIVLLVQYHSKDSVVMGDGYNIYNTVFSCVPLFICNLGIYTASVALFINKRQLYALSFFVHAGGALSVFLYFGKDGLSNFGIFCSYSILYFVFTHSVLFALCILPVALRLYKFTIKQCIVPLIYYLIVIVTACVTSALVTSYSIDSGMTGGDILYPNYAFTQINPFPVDVPEWLTIKLWNYDINVVYEMALYIGYVCIFFSFYGAYRLWLLVYGRVVKKADL